MLDRTTGGKRHGRRRLRTPYIWGSSTTSMSNRTGSSEKKRGRGEGFISGNAQLMTLSKCDSTKYLKIIRFEPRSYPWTTASPTLMRDCVGQCIVKVVSVKFPVPFNASTLWFSSRMQLVRGSSIQFLENVDYGYEKGRHFLPHILSLFLVMRLFSTEQFIFGRTTGVKAWKWPCYSQIQPQVPTAFSCRW
jgi:hypothetical protein